MKRIMIAAMLLISGYCQSQVNYYRASKLIADKRITLSGNSVDSISNDTTMISNAANILPTQYAVRKFVENSLRENTITSLPWSGITGVPTASGSVNGILSSTNWTTFNNKFSSVGGSLTGTGGAGYLGLIPQSSNPSTPASGVVLYARSTGAFSWKGTNGFQRSFIGTGISADRDYTLPDATGTLVLNDNTATITNKTINGSSNTITNVSLSAGVTGSLPDGNISSASTWNAKATTASVGAKLDTSASYLTSVVENSDNLYNTSSMSYANHVGTITQNLTTQSAYKLFGTGSSSATPNWLSSIDSNYIPALHTESYYNTKYLTVSNPTATGTFTIGQLINMVTPSSATNGLVYPAANDGTVVAFRGTNYSVTGYLGFSLFAGANGIVSNGNANTTSINAAGSIIGLTTSGIAFTPHGGGSGEVARVKGNSLLVGTTTEIASAKVVITSTSSGFLPPRMTTSQRTGIASPAEGLLVYDTDLHKLYGYDGSAWQAAW